MIKEKNFELDEIKEIRLNHDFEDVIFPRSVIKKISYTYNKEKQNYFQDGLYLSGFYLEVSLDYVLNENSYFNFEKTENHKNIDILKFNNIWYIGIKTNDDIEYELEIPFYSKNFYLDKNTNVHNDKNLFETHEKKGESYIIKWSEDKNLTKLNLNEMFFLFQNEKKKGAPITNHNFQIEALNRLLKEKDENERISFLSNFCYLLNKEIKRIETDYKIETTSKHENDLRIVTLNISNQVNKGSINYIFIEYLNDYQNLLNLLNSINRNNAFNKTILILNDDLNLDDFSKKITENLENVDNIICINLNKINQIWFELIHTWGI